MKAVRQAFVAAGSNQGDRLSMIRESIARLGSRPDVRMIVTSHIYETEPVGVTEQPRFLNAVVGIETTLSPEALLGVLQEIEQEFGRVRSIRWGPRTLDLDLLAFEGETRSSAQLVLPHPRMLERAFVTVPLGDVLARRPFDSEQWEELRRALPRPTADAGVTRFL